MGYGKIAVIPTVNLGYYNQTDIKVPKGYVSNYTNNGVEKGGVKIDWQLEAPERVKCGPDLRGLRWMPWNDSLHDEPDSQEGA